MPSLDLSYRNASDEELVAIVRSSGDARDRRLALDELFARYWQPINTWVDIYLWPHRDYELREECRSRARIGLMKEVRNRNQTLPKPFRRAVRARCRFAVQEEFADRRKLAQRNPLYEEPELAPGVLRRISESELRFQAIEDRVAFEARIAVLSPEDQQLLRWFLIEDLSAAKIAERLGIDRNAVDQRKHRAIEKLRTGADR